MSETLRDGVVRFLGSLRTERRLSPHTAASYGRDLEVLLAWFDSQGIASWDALDAQHRGAPGAGRRSTSD